MPIWISRDDDLDKSLGYLTIYLILLHMEKFRHIEDWFGGIAANIAKTLGPIPVSLRLGCVSMRNSSTGSNEICGSHIFEILRWQKSVGSSVAENVQRMDTPELFDLTVSGRILIN